MNSPRLQTKNLELEIDGQAAQVLVSGSVFGKVGRQDWSAGPLLLAMLMGEAEVPPGCIMRICESLCSRATAVQMIAAQMG